MLCAIIFKREAVVERYEGWSKIPVNDLIFIKLLTLIGFETNHLQSTLLQHIHTCFTFPATVGNMSGSPLSLTNLSGPLRLPWCLQRTLTPLATCPAVHGWEESCCSSTSNIFSWFGTSGCSLNLKLRWKESNLRPMKTSRQTQRTA